MMSGDARRGEIWWATLDEPIGSRAGYRHPVVIVSADRYNTTAIGTLVACVLTSNIDQVGMVGNVLIPRRDSGLRRDSVVNVTQIAAIDRSELDRLVGRLPSRLLDRIDEGLRLVLDL